MGRQYTDADLEAGAEAFAGPLLAGSVPPSYRRTAAAAVLDAVLPDHDAQVRAEHEAALRAAGWRPPIRHGDPDMLAAVYGYELGQEDAARHEAEEIPGWAHEQDVTYDGDTHRLDCAWCNNPTTAIEAGDSLEDILTAARDHDRTCAHRLAARRHATPPTTEELTCDD